TLIQMSASGKLNLVADLALYEFDHNPAGDPLDSNPFSVLAEPGGRVIADAGGNSLIRVAANGRIETIATFPSQPNPTPVGPPRIASVATSVVRGSDGAPYVGELTGVPSAPGLARVWRGVPGQAPVVHC